MGFGACDVGVFGVGALYISIEIITLGKNLALISHAEPYPTMRYYRVTRYTPSVNDSITNFEGVYVRIPWKTAL